MGRETVRRWIQNAYRYAHRYTVGADALDILLLAIACALAVNTVSVSSWAAIVLGSLYLSFLIVKFFLTIQQRRAVDRLKGDTLWGLFDMLNELLFDGDPYVRFTLFCIDPLNSSYIIPWYRYERPSGQHPIRAAQSSQARYERGEGCTGAAWAGAGQNRFQLTVLPPFATRHDFEHYYVGNLGIRPDVVGRLSNYMVGVGVILSCPITDTRGVFLGLLSIDCQWQVTSYDPLEMVAPDGTRRQLDSSYLVVISLLVQNVLRSFATAEARRLS